MGCVVGAKLNGDGTGGNVLLSRFLFFFTKISGDGRIYWGQQNERWNLENGKTMLLTPNFVERERAVIALF